jgi:prepilin-type N-terminal cleavage/methylation domain-containing protein
MHSTQLPRTGIYLVLALASLSLTPFTASAQTTVFVDVFDFDFGDFNTRTGFDPTITVGDTVTWRFQEGFHTTTSDTGQAEQWDSGILFPPETFSHQFTNTGDFTYVCTLHTTLGMSGVIHVQPIPEPSTGLLAAAIVGLVGSGGRRALRLVRAPPTGRPAFTLIELLVVLALVGLMIGLLLPAVHRVREAANRASCRNNLKQIALAAHCYEGTHAHFPGLGLEPHQDSALTRLLPYLEQEALQRSIAADQPLFFSGGGHTRLIAVQQPAARVVVRSFLCPSDSQPPLFHGYDWAVTAGNNYVFNAGTGTATTYDFRYPTDGMAWYGSRVRHRDVTDGLSSTMLASEALMGTGIDAYSPGAANHRRHWLSTGCHAFPNESRPGTTQPLTDDLCMMTFAMTWRGDRGLSWIGGPGHRGLFNTYYMPNDRMIDCGTFGLGWFKASSNHPGGVHMVLGDGSVHFVKNHIMMEVWRALSTRSDREILGSYCGCE